MLARKAPEEFETIPRLDTRDQVCALAVQGNLDAREHLLGSVVEVPIRGEVEIGPRGCRVSVRAREEELVDLAAIDLVRIAANDLQQGLCASPL